MDQSKQTHVLGQTPMNPHTLVPTSPTKLPTSKRHRGRPRQHIVTVAEPNSQTNPELPSLIDVQAVAQVLGVKKGYVYDLVQRNEIPYKRIGKYLRFSVAELQRWLDAHESNR